MRYGMAQFLLEIADDKQPDTEVIANANDMAVDLSEERKLQHDDLRDAALDDDPFEIIGITQDGDAIRSLVDSLVANETDGAQPNIRFATQPASQLRGFFS